eukprot:TRINITY_DN294_c0_g1_i1.p1 TRINITY_DN294_c0_g1~~TRINITY_DN294_c0_g1_i1.p1  ORF type:complete len:604 (-),score=137.19 TRINITY_DN294_c0_g1_i1:329-2140(-)
MFFHPPWLKKHNNISNWMSLSQEIMDYAEYMSQQPEEKVLRVIEARWIEKIIKESIVDSLFWYGDHVKYQYEEKLIHKGIEMKLESESNVSMTIEEKNIFFKQMHKEIVELVNNSCKMVIYGSNSTGILLPDADIDLCCDIDSDLLMLLQESARKFTDKMCIDKSSKFLSEMTEFYADTDFTIDYSTYLTHFSFQDYIELLKRSEYPPFVIFHLIQQKLLKFDMVTLADIKIITKAKVPIIKFISKKSTLQVDLSFNQSSGSASTKFLIESLKIMPEAFPLIMVLKQFLKSRGLNEVYSGGLSSYGVAVLIIFFLSTYDDLYPYVIHTYTYRSKQMSGKRINSMYEQTKFARYLVDFFDFFGNRFDYKHMAMAVINGKPTFIPKKKVKDQVCMVEKDYQNYPERMVLIDPEDPTNNIFKGGFLIRNIISSFKYAYSTLISALHVVPPSFSSSVASNPKPTLEKSQRVVPDSSCSFLNRITVVDIDFSVKRSNTLKISMDSFNLTNESIKNFLENSERYYNTYELAKSWSSINANDPIDKGREIDTNFIHDSNFNEGKKKKSHKHKENRAFSENQRNHHHHQNSHKRIRNNKLPKQNKKRNPDF